MLFSSSCKQWRRLRLLSMLAILCSYYDSVLDRSAGGSMLVAAAATTAAPEEEKDNHFVCGVYLAKSTLPGTGIGMYAGRNGYRKDELITKQLGDHVIPITDLKETHIDTGLYDEDANDMRKYFLWDQYTWNARVFGLNVENLAAHEPAMASAGFGAAANSFMDFVNVEEGGVKFGLMDSEDSNDDGNDDQNYNIHRSRDPGAGSFSPFHSRAAWASKEIGPYSEFFVSYGDRWFTDRAWRLGIIPVSGDHEDAERLWKSYDRNFLGGRKRQQEQRERERNLEKLQQQAESKTDEDIEEDENENENNDDEDEDEDEIEDDDKFDSTLLKNIYREFWDTVIIPIGKDTWGESRVFAALPEAGSDHYEQMLKYPGGFLPFKQSLMKRSASWLEEHGVCADAVRIGRSTLPNKQAGHGAFSRTHFEPGDVVLTAPLIHIPHRDILDTYYVFEENYNQFERDPSDDDGEKDDENKNPDRIDYDALHEDRFFQYQLRVGMNKTGTQLLMNYVFGHNESTLLLSPYGPGVQLVNHNQTLQNLKLQWAETHRSNHHPELLEKSVDVLTRDHPLGSVLTLELIATKPIAPDDELFLDYGDAWEAAWNEHVRNWKPYPGKHSTYVSAIDLNTRDEHLREPLPSLYTMKDHDTLLPPSVRLMVSNAWRNEEYRRRYGDHSITAKVMFDEFEYEPVEVVFKSGKRDSDPQDGSGATTDDDHKLYPPELDPTLYTVVVNVRIEDEEEKDEENEGDDEEPKYQRVTFSDVPRRAFMFEDMTGTQDLYLPNAFRHPILIPDDIFPEAWKNRKHGNSNDDKKHGDAFPSQYGGYAAFTAAQKKAEKEAKSQSELPAV